MASATGEEKAAILLNSLPPEVAEGLLARLGPERGGRVRAQMQRFEQSPQPPEVLDQALEEVTQLLRQSSGDSVEISAQARAAAAYQESQKPEAQSEETEAAPAAGDHAGQLRQLKDELLANTLEGEQPRTIALVLNLLDAKQAGAVLKQLPAEVRRAVSVQLSQATAPSMDLVQRIAEALLIKSQSRKDTPVVEAGDAKFKKMAEMLRPLEKEDRLDMLAAIEEKDPETAARLKEYLYQFEDLLLIEDRSMQKLLSEIDSKSLATSLKGASDEIRDKVLRNLSQRARDALSEEMEFLGSVPTKQVREAQKAVVEVIQRLDQAGELVMKQ
jgi:flagellar motor switch protein FliG